MLDLEEIARKRGKDFEILARELELDFAADHIPLAEFMQRKPVSLETAIKATQSNRVRAEYFFALGVDRLAVGEREEARAFFQDCLDTGYYEFFVYWWSSLFLNRIDDPNWLPWLIS